MKNTFVNTERLKTVLPRGAVKEIAKRSNTTIFTVSRVVNGKSKNKEVIDEINAYLKELSSTAETIEASINTLSGVS